MLPPLSVLCMPFFRLIVCHGLPRNSELKHNLPRVENAPVRSVSCRAVYVSGFLFPSRFGQTKSFYIFIFLVT